MPKEKSKDTRQDWWRKAIAKRAGIDYDELFAPVARLETVRLIFSLAAQNN